MMDDTPRYDIPRRPRRNRRTQAIRDLVEETAVHPADLIQPLFVKDGTDAPTPVDSMPGIVRHNADTLAAEAVRLHEAGLRAVALFPQIDPAHKDDRGTFSAEEANWFFGVISKLKREVPGLLVIADVALDPYTTHGHDGILTTDGTDVANDETVAALEAMALCLARAGADLVAPSDMMDGRIGAIRGALDDDGHEGVGILAYAAKFASSFYGPFRDAVGSRQAAGTAHLDKRTYQLNPANRREAMLDAMLDAEEGADILMVKPAGPYLDVLAELRRRTDLPLAAYQVSGEYAMIHAAGERGWLDLDRARDESLLAIKRAGADMILTYFASSLVSP